jgi:hypothetical protein
MPEMGRGLATLVICYGEGALVAGVLQWFAMARIS